MTNSGNSEEKDGCWLSEERDRVHEIEQINKSKTKKCTMLHYYLNLNDIVCKNLNKDKDLDVRVILYIW